MNLLPIYSHPITALPEVLERLEQNPEALELTSEIQRVFVPGLFTITEQPIKHFHLFKVAFCGSWGFAAHEWVVENRRLYSTVMNECVGQCNNISGLIIEALRHQHRALAYMHTQQDPKLTLASLARTGPIIDTLFDSYNEIYHQLSKNHEVAELLFTQVDGQLLSLELEEVPPP